MDWQTFGHNNVKNILGKQNHSGIFAHAYLFAGPEGVGKKSLALEFAKKVLAHTNLKNQNSGPSAIALAKADNDINLQNHPDFQILDMEGEITVEPILDFIGKLRFKPFVGSKKIAIINNAQNLNLQSGNALLKTLEEPSASTIIILVSSSTGVLPTIVSRCQVLNFSAFSREALQEFAQKNNLDITPQMLDLSFGQICRLKRLAEDNAFLEQQQQIISEYQKIKQLTLGQKLISINNFALMEPEELGQNLNNWLLWQGIELFKRPEEFAKVQALTESVRALYENKNKKLLLQGLFLKI